MARWIDDVDRHNEFASDYTTSAIASENDCAGWFHDRFLHLSHLGPAFFSMAAPDRAPAIILNEDFFAGVVGGERRLGHQVVFHPQEGEFYFKDPVVGAFCPTSEEKLQLLLSNYMVRCCMEAEQDPTKVPLMREFRASKVLKRIISKAKALLQADLLFFMGPNGHRRYLEGRYIEPTDEPSYRQFARIALVARPGSRLTLPDAFHQYYRFCVHNQMQPLTRSEFKHLVAEVIRQEFSVGLRHDVPGRSGKANHGWFGIDCRLECSRN